MTVKIEVRKGVERPKDLPSRGGGGELKYPLQDMKEKDDYFEVPKEMFFGDQEFEAERYDVKRHRERVNSAVRAYALKMNKAAQAEPDFNAAEFKPMRFTVAALESGNIGVWRDQ